MSNSRADEIIRSHEKLKSARSRFAAKHTTGDGCWLWTAACNPAGYGKMMFNGRIQSAHRISWNLYRGEIPDGMFVCHTCDVTSCVNPAHLFLGTASDNTQDCIAKGRHRPPRGETCGRSKLSEQQVREIRAITGRLAYGESQRLAARYGVNDATIWRIRKGERWGSVNG